MGRSPLDPSVVDLVHHEAALLDARRLEEWLGLFAPDGLLWVPGRSGEADPACHVSIIYDHLPQLRARVTRLLSGKETAQDPPSRTLRAVTNLGLVEEPDGDGELLVESVQVLHETRGVGAPLLVLPARVTYRLRPVGEAGAPFDWAIVCKRIDLLEVERHFDNLAFLL
ncbi:MAG: aromatic-ring-hydroxylating dioxygenase subunit beta [Acidimicrobiales bacterium]